MLKLDVPYDSGVLKYLEQRSKRNPKYKIPDRIYSVTLCYNLQEYDNLNKEKEAILKEK